MLIIAEAYPDSCQTSKVGQFAKIVNSFQVVTARML